MQYPQYDPTGPNSPLSAEELDALDRLLAAVPGEQAMNVEAMDGYFTALLLAPVPLPRVPTADWLPAVWGGDGADGAPFASGRARKRVMLLALRHLHATACQLRDAPDGWEPVFSVAEVDGEELADAEDWCAGFLQAVALDPAGWEAVFDDAELGAALVPLVLLGGDEAQLSPEDAAGLDDPRHRDALSRAVADAAVLLHERRAGPLAQPGA